MLNGISRQPDIVHNAGFNERISHLNQTISDLDRQITSFQQQERQLQNEIDQLKHEINLYRTSTSWRITKPIRKFSLANKKLTRLLKFYQNYRSKYPGIRGYYRILQKSLTALAKGGFKGLKHAIFVSEMTTLAKTLLSNSISSENYSTHEMYLLKGFLTIDLIKNITVLFDHNDGGGANIYTDALIKTITAEGGSILRIYPSNKTWCVQLIHDDANVQFNTLLIEDLFSTLALSNSTNIIINSLYGHSNLSVSVSHIVKLAEQLSASLDFKINDFHSLCPSLHLLNFKDTYCGVPQDIDICKNCLHKNLEWYPAWYPKENRPLDIEEWRKPFEALLKAADTITFFDPSSIEIVRKAFYIESSKINVVPHNSNYFKCEKNATLDGPLHIGVLGNLTKIKGAEVVKDLSEHINSQNMHIPITIVGSSFVNIPCGVRVHGKYEPTELPDIINKRGINVILMASLIPETFSYTISEAMKMKLPIVTFDIGAQGNRVKQYELGTVIPLNSSPEVILDAIQSILNRAVECKKND